MFRRVAVTPTAIDTSVGYSFDPNQPVAVDDVADVTQMVDNPRLVDLRSNWRGGQPDWIDRNAVSVMFEFKNCVEELLQQPLADGHFAGPRFLHAGP